MSRPLDGIKVIDCGRILAGPYTSMLLADLGANVIKIERPGGNGDEMRAYGPPFLKDEHGVATTESPFYLAANRNKRAICIDISKPEGQDILRKLVADADVFVENFKVGDLARYGLDYESLSRINQRLIYCSITGFGQTGPLAKSPGQDMMFQAMSGLMSVTGEPDGPPLRVGMAYPDILGGMTAVYAILAALYHRDAQGGVGQFIDLSLLDSVVELMSHRIEAYLVSGVTPPRMGNQTAAAFPARDFPCSDGAVMMQASRDDHFRRLCSAMGRPDLMEDDRFNTRAARYTHRTALNSVLADIFRTKTMAEWTDILTEAKVMCSPINTIAQAMEHPQIRHRELTVEAPHPLAGKVPLLRNPVRFSQTPLDTYTAPPTKGQHTEAILGELGLDEAAITRLRSAGVVE